MKIIVFVFSSLALALLVWSHLTPKPMENLKAFMRQNRANTHDSSELAGHVFEVTNNQHPVIHFPEFKKSKGEDKVAYLLVLTVWLEANPNPTEEQSMMLPSIESVLAEARSINPKELPEYSRFWLQLCIGSLKRL
jgi:hypothetical protein